MFVAAGAEIDDRPTFAGSDHAARDPLRVEEGALEIGADHGIPAVFGEFEHRGPGLDAGIVDEHVGRLSRPVNHLVEKILDRGAVGHLAVPADRLSAKGCDFSLDLGSRIALAEMDEGDIIALPHEGRDEMPADAGTAAGDDRELGHLVLPDCCH